MRRRGGCFGKTEQKSVLFFEKFQAASRRTNSFQLCADSAAPPRLRQQQTCAALCSRRRSNTFPPRRPAPLLTSQQPRAACRALHPPPHASKQPLPLRAAVTARSMPYKSGAPKCRWMGPGAQGHSLFMGFVDAVEGVHIGMVVMHTDQVSQQLFF